MHPAVIELSKGFSCPLSSTDTGHLTTIVVEHAKLLTRSFLDAFGQELQAHGHGLYEFIEQGIDSIDFEIAWDSLFPSLYRHVHSYDAYAARKAAMGIGLKLAWAGVEGTWSFDAARPHAFRWGEWYLPKTQSLRLSVTRGSAKLDLPGMGCVEYHRCPSGWRGVGLQTQPTFSVDGTTVAVHTPSTLESIDYPPVQLTACSFPEVIGTCNAAVKVLKLHAPEYLRWVSRVLRHVIPVSGSETKIESGSDYYRPGVIEASFPVNAVGFSEVLVHECSHQYLNWLSRLGPLVDGTDTRLYYSPVKEQPRALINILIAYHAFANVLLFYRSCRKTDLADVGYCTRNEEKLIPKLVELEVYLRSSTGFTPLGDSLWRPVSAHIDLHSTSVFE